MSSNQIGADELKRKAKLKTAQLEKRKEERIESTRTRKDEDVERTSKLETYEFFTSQFQKESDALWQNLDAGSITAKSDRADITKYLEDVSDSFEKLIKFLNDSMVFLRPYQVEKAHKTIGELHMELMKKKEELAPRKKFAFKSKKKVGDSSKENLTPVPKQVSKTKIDLTQSQCQVSLKNSETIHLKPEEINGNDVALSKLTDCILTLEGHPGTVHVNDVKNCTILCGPVSGSVFVEKCMSSRIVTGCQQLRVHETTETDFYLHVTSRAIIEDSNSLRFAPYNWSYSRYLEDVISSGLKSEVNNWDKVDDFNWLSEEHSPNWSILSECDRENDWSKYVSS